MDRDFINRKLRVCLENIIINNGTYAFQTYQIWMLFAKHKIKSNELIRYATINIEKNDETNKPVIAAMIIYLCSVEYNYSRVILRKFKEGFTLGYFQNRVTLIALRRFSPKLIPIAKVHNALKTAPSFTYLYKNKDLVYANGFNENNNPDNQIEQLYSI